MSQPPPDDLKAWTKNDLIRELRRLRAVLREHAEQPGSDPRAAQAPNAAIDVMGDPHAKGGVMLDARSAVLLDNSEVILVDTKRDEPPSMMLVLRGRVNYSHDRVEHAYLYGPDGAAAIVSEHLGLAGRAAQHDERFGDEFMRNLDKRMTDLP